MKCAVIGASDNPSRYSYLAIKALLHKGHEVIPYGIKRNTTVHGLAIRTDRVSEPDVHTVTLYVGPAHQQYWRELIEQMQPQRIIFNPGTENDEMMSHFQNLGFTVIEGCTLVMLSTGLF
jgi:predicted CoA-binding protein